MALTASKTATSFGRGRRWMARLNALACLLITLYILYLANIVFYRHPWRVDFTQERLHSLSGDTLAKLELVREEIRVVFPYRRGSRDPVQAGYLRVLDRARNLLEEYMTRQPLIKVVADVDVYSEPDRWKTIATEFNLLPAQTNRLIFCAGDNTFRQTLTPRDLAVFDPVNVDVVAPLEIREFTGEWAITDAIMRLIHRERKKAYITQDKGELRLFPTRSVGLAALRHELEASGFKAEELSISDLVTRAKDVPEDCELLVIPGPEEVYSKRELDVIERYLVRDGRIFVSLGNEHTGLEGLLERWGIKVDAGKISMRQLQSMMRLDTSWVAAGGLHPGHPVTRPLMNTAVFQARMLSPRPLKPTSSASRLQSVSLVETGKSTSQTRYFLKGADLDVPGNSFALAVAAWQDALERPPPGWEQRKSRLVVVGASSFLRDPEQGAAIQGGFLSGSHRDLFMNCAHWLVGEEKQLTQGRERVDRKIKMSASIRRFLFFSSVVVFPGVFLCLGLFLYFLRRA